MSNGNWDQCDTVENKLDSNGMTLNILICQDPPSTGKGKGSV